MARGSVGEGARVRRGRPRAGTRTLGVLLTIALVAVGLFTAATTAAAEPGTETPVGTNVTVVPVDTTSGTSPVEITFAEVLVAGETSLTTTTTFTGTPALPLDSWGGESPLYYEVSTTATIEADVLNTLCFSYGSVADEDTLRVFEWSDGGWALRNVANRDTANDELCVEQPFGLQSPSVFVLVSPDPVATDDLATGSEVDPVEIDVLANDTDLAGHALSLTIWPGNGPGAGFASVNEAGDRIIYQAFLYYCGEDQFHYTLSDSVGNVSVAKVTVDIPCIDAPPRAFDDNFTIPQDNGAFIFDPAENDRDDDLAAPANLIYEFFEVGGEVSAPAFGTATIDAAGPGPHQVTYTPDPGFCGNDFFILKVTDGSGLAPNFGLTAVNFEVECPPPPDTTAPEFVRLNLSAGTIDTTDSDVPISAYVRFFDEGWGFGNVVAGSITFTSPSGNESVSTTLFPIGLGNPGETDLYGELTVPQGSEEGTWVLDSIEVEDLAGNPMSVSALEAQLLGTTYSFVNVAPSAPVDDHDGIPAEVEDAGPNGGDTNWDGVPDSWQPNVASFPNAKDGRYVAIQSETGTTIQNVTTAVGPPDGSVTPGVVYPVGLIGYEVHGLHSDHALVEFLLPDGVSIGQVQKMDASDVLTDVPLWFGDDGYVVSTGNLLSVFLKDGGAFDADATQNGVLVDPVLLGRTNQAPQLSVFPNPLITNPGVTKTAFVSAFDMDFGDVLTVTVGAAQHGTTFNDPVRYVADPTYLGADSFTVSVSDGYTTTTVTVNVQVVVPPTITCSPVVLNIPANGSIRLLDSSLLGAIQGACNSSDGTFVSTSFPFGMQHGTVNGSLVYRPFKDFVGQDTILSNATTATGGAALLSAVVNVIGATASADQGNPGDPFTVSFYCKGLATVSVTKPGPVVVGSGAKSATGPVSFDFTVPAEPGGTVLTITPVCNNAYSSYTGGNGYSGYNSSAWATLPALSFTVSGTPDDGDGVTEPPGYDGDGDGTDDALQKDVTSVDAPTGAGVVTIVAPNDEYSLTSVTATVPDDLPPGVDAPIGVIGFTVELPEGAPAEVDVELIIPAGVTITTVLKDLNGTIIDFTEHATIDLPNHRVILHLIDGEQGDADGERNFRIEDPVILQSGYDFTGFGPPIRNDAVNKAKAGQTVHVKWRITTADGEPVSDPASFVALDSSEVPCESGRPGPKPKPESKPKPPGPPKPEPTPELKYRGNGEWEYHWKTDKAWKGQCHTMTLHLADQVGNRTASFEFK